MAASFRNCIIIGDKSATSGYRCCRGPPNHFLYEGWIFILFPLSHVQFPRIWLTSSCHLMLGEALPRLVVKNCTKISAFSLQRTIRHRRAAVVLHKPLLLGWSTSPFIWKTMGVQTPAHRCFISLRWFCFKKFNQKYLDSPVEDKKTMTYRISNFPKIPADPTSRAWSLVMIHGGFGFFLSQVPFVWSTWTTVYGSQIYHWVYKSQVV